jgi:hypothetical protein
MPQYQGELGVCQLAVSNVKIGPADAAGLDLDQQLAGAGSAHRYPGHSQGPPRLIEQHRSHITSSAHLGPRLPGFGQPALAMVLTGSHARAGAGSDKIE